MLNKLLSRPSTGWIEIIGLLRSEPYFWFRMHKPSLWRLPGTWQISHIVSTPEIDSQIECRISEDAPESVGRIHWQATLLNYAMQWKSPLSHTHTHRAIAQSSIFSNKFSTPFFQLEPSAPFESCVGSAVLLPFILYVYWFEMNLRVSEAKRRIRSRIGISSTFPTGISPRPRPQYHGAAHLKIFPQQIAMFPCPGWGYHK